MILSHIFDIFICLSVRLSDNLKKKTEIRHLPNLKKKTEINHWPPCSAHTGVRGPSLGFLGPNSMVSSNLPSVRSGRVGLVSYPGRTVIRVGARNSTLRVARTDMMPNSDSTENFTPGVKFWGLKAWNSLQKRQAWFFKLHSFKSDHGGERTTRAIKHFYKNL